MTFREFKSAVLDALHFSTDFFAEEVLIDYDGGQKEITVHIKEDGHLLQDGATLTPTETLVVLVKRDEATGIVAEDLARNLRLQRKPSVDPSMRWFQYQRQSEDGYPGKNRLTFTRKRQITKGHA